MEARIAFFNNFIRYLLEGNRQTCTRMIINLAEDGISIKDIYLDILQRALIEVGDLWQKNVITVAQEHICTAIVQSIMSSLYQMILPDERNNKNVIVTCIGSELHEVGARMVSDFYEMDGFNVKYLGANVPTKSIINMVENNPVDVIGISCTMKKHVEISRDLIKLLKNAKNRIKIAVGGYCFNNNPDLVDYVNADIWSPDAQRTVDITKSLVF